MNMSRKGDPDPEMYNVQAVEPADVRREYGADKGYTASFVPDPTFSTYKGGAVWFLMSEQRKTIAMNIILFTPDKDGGAPNSVLEALSDIQYALRFK
jgi:hypothetical protein